MSISRYVLPVVVGAMAGMMLISAGEQGVHTMYPFDAGLDLHDRDSVARAMAAMPLAAFVMLLVNYVICSFGAGLAATMVAGRTTARPAVVVGIVLTLAGLYNVLNLPHPLWFIICSIPAYLPAAYIGYAVVKKKK